MYTLTLPLATAIRSAMQIAVTIAIAVIRNFNNYELLNKSCNHSQE